MLRESWDNAVTRLAGQPTGGEELVRRYAEPHRKYHNTAHVLAVLAAAGMLSTSDNPVLVLAICAHDVIYNGRPGDDEHASADWARAQLTEAGVAEKHIARVESLVLATITHSSDDSLGQILLDADLSILGSPPDVYDEYTRRVREEYAKYDDQTWRLGRAQVLQTLITRESLYVTDAARRLWNENARANMARELEALTRN